MADDASIEALSAATAPKGKAASAAAGTAKPRAKQAPKKKVEPLARRQSNEQDPANSANADGDVDVVMEVKQDAKAMASLEPSAASSSRTTPVPGTKKSATETYQKVRAAMAGWRVLAY